MDLFFAVPALSIGFTTLGILLLILILGVHYRVECRRRQEAGFRNTTSPFVERYLAGSARLDEALAVLKTNPSAARAFLLDHPELSSPGKTERLQTLFRNLPCQEDLSVGLEDNDPDIRAQNAQQLGYLGDETAIPGLVRALDDEAAHVRMAAAHSLALLRHPGAVQAILRNPNFAGNMPDDRVVEVLFSFGNAAIDPLLSVLAAAPITERTLSIVVQACGLLQAKPAVPKLVETLRHANPQIRRKTMDALASIGDPSAIPHVAHLADDPDPVVRSRAMSSLGILRATAHIPLLVQALGDPAWEIRLSAGRALYQIGDEGRKALEKTAAQSPDSPARGISRQILQTHGHDLPAGKDSR